MKNKLALCSRGQLGLITHDKRQPVTYTDHSVGMAYVGYSLNRRAGPQSWRPVERTRPHSRWGIAAARRYAVTGLGLVPDVTRYDIPVTNE
jgi:hypothetical protein